MVMPRQPACQIIRCIQMRQDDLFKTRLAVRRLQALIFHNMMILSIALFDARPLSALFYSRGILFHPTTEYRQRKTGLEGNKRSTRRQDTSTAMDDASRLPY